MVEVPRNIMAARLNMVLVGVWMLVAMLQGEAASPVHTNMTDHMRMNSVVRAPKSRSLTGDSQSHNPQPKLHIVHMHKSFNSHNAADQTPHSRYIQLLKTMSKRDTSTTSSDHHPVRPTHVYSSVCHGFTASLTPQEAASLRKMTGVLGVYPDTIRSPHTTRTPEFLGLSNLRGAWPEGHFGEDIIVGVLDTGVWPERDSFSDFGMGPVPAKWKGRCEGGNGFTCNKKLIGARYYLSGYEDWLNRTGKAFNESLDSRSARDTMGHGTHTASTAAGSPVAGASMFGLANGTARGVAPRARIAVYKICWHGGCFDSDILAAFDQAVADGVDVISISVGGPNSNSYSVDMIAVGSFGAMEKGIFVSASAGNDGPELQTVTNVAPWMMTVAASTVDRHFPATIMLGNGHILHGESMYVGDGLGNVTGMITGVNATSGNVTESKNCLPGSLNRELVKGKIVLCERGVNGREEKGEVVKSAGGAGMILYNTGSQDGGVIPDTHVLPAVNVDGNAGIAILAYMRGTATPVAEIRFLSTQYNVKKAPIVAGFSSRGPNLVTPQVLKPDITGPGVGILAAWTGAVGPTGLETDTRSVEFGIVSGTSMACPHISGIAALLKSTHPDWSPAAIKSAMMTTATILAKSDGQELISDEYGPGEATPFHFGSGHVRPQLALDPGLVYDMGVHDYINFLCASNYSSDTIHHFTHIKTYPCPQPPIRLEDLNYPSFAAVFLQPPSPESISMNMTRVVTNVGYANATYRAEVVQPADAVITVVPEVLTFDDVHEKKSFIVQVTTVNAPSSTLVNVSFTDFGFLSWTDGTRVVQSPIAITVYKYSPFTKT